MFEMCQNVKRLDTAKSKRESCCKTHHIRYGTTQRSIKVTTKSNTNTHSVSLMCSVSIYDSAAPTLSSDASFDLGVGSDEANFTFENDFAFS